MSAVNLTKASRCIDSSINADYRAVQGWMQFICNCDLAGKADLETIKLALWDLDRQNGKARDREEELRDKLFQAAMEWLSQQIQDSY